MGRISRPFVLFNAAVSLDGKLAPASRHKIRLGSDRDRARMDRLRASSDAILVGAATIRAEDPPLQVRSERLRRARARSGKPPHLVEIVVSRSLRLSPSLRFFREPARSRILAVPAAASRAAVRRFEGICEVWNVGRGGLVDPAILLRRLARRGIGRLLVEGGGVTFSAFFDRGLVDEIHLTVTGWAIGGSQAPTLFDGRGFLVPPFPKFDLAVCRREGEEVYLVFRAPTGGKRPPGRAS